MRYRPSASVLPICSVLLLAAFAGCADLDNSGDGDDGGEGDVKFYVKDAPPTNFEPSSSHSTK